MNELGQAISRNGLLLAGFALLTALLVAGIQLGTREEIAAAKRAAEEKALLQIVPRSAHDNSMLDDRLPAPSGEDLLRLPETRSIYRARRGSEVSAVILPAHAPDGYGGGIDLLVGIDRDGRVAGVRVLGHRETPGLGDAVDHRKSDWIERFRGRALGSPPEPRWKVRRDGGDFDQFTGATITPRAVVEAVRRALHYAEAHHAQLFDAAARETAAAPRRVPASESETPT